MINEALEYYNFINPNTELIRHNENLTYRISEDSKCYVLRIHKPIDGLNLDLLRMNKDKTEQIVGEVELLLHLEKQGNLLTQKVKKNIYGNAVTVLEDKTPVTVLEWIEGNTLENIDITEVVAYEIGVMIGKMHNDFEHISIPTRYQYNDKLLSKMIDEASIARKQGHFNDKHTKIMIETLLYMKNYFLNENHKFIIVHSDLGKSNLVYHNNTVIPIDFSLSGYCIPEMDLASIFSHINNEALNQEILNGYKSICRLKPKSIGIDVCYCWQILLFLIVQHNKIAGQPWLESKLDEWCENQFKPLINTANADS